jgi:hypothetical protein
MRHGVIRSEQLAPADPGREFLELAMPDGKLLIAPDDAELAQPISVD